MSRLEFLTDPRFGDGRVRHGFTTRQGGVSKAPYDSLNLSWSRGDQKVDIDHNRTLVSDQLDGVQLVFLNQVHSDKIIEVSNKPQSGWTAGEGDALISNVAGLGLCALTADCVPVLLYDPSSPAIAAIHSGWRGTVQAIIPKTLKRMQETYGTRAETLQAIIGPAISKAHYRVGPEVLEQFETGFGPLDTGLIGPLDPEGGAGLDVGEACRRQLVGAGVNPDLIFRLDHCTYSDPERFFSCRRSAHKGQAGLFGGQAGVIALMP